MTVFGGLFRITLREADLDERGLGMEKGADKQDYVQLLRCAYTVPVTHLLDSVEQHALIVQIELCRDDSDDHACKHLYLMLERQAPESLALLKLAMH